MIKILAYVIIILIGLCLTPYIIDSKGYIYIAMWDYQIETSLAFGLVSLILLLIALELTKWLLIRVLSLVMASRFLPERWRAKNAKKLMEQGALALAEEDWATAETAMSKSADSSPLPIINYFAAARAAHHANHHQARDTYLDKAEQQPSAKNAVLTSRVRYYLQQGQLTQARQQLELLSPTSKSKNSVLKVASDLYLAQSDWSALKLILPSLTKKKVLEDALLAELVETTNTALINQAASISAEELNKVWGWFEKSERQNASVFAAYLQGLKQQNRHDEAVKLLTKQLKSSPSAQLFDLVPSLITADDLGVRKLLNRFEQTHENDASYQICQAKLAQQSRDMKAAKLHWQNACRIFPCRLNWLALAQVQEQLGENGTAMQSYRHAANAED